ncbi:porin [Thorsellia anophelis]|uniref:Outer membrane pore protein F n=1 Tax=Thorsellia anophelis DSM 18579 TaxID=1123402 RepID=A0A1I0G5C2_9GAMM|nr:porin [Thorsellia anophelis]SET65120.1 outer membrane pore protein F [Thorsellia anophelis DSM 18579]
MKKRKILAIIVSSLLVANSSLAAEIYNKNGNKINLIGQVSAIYTFKEDKTPMYDWSKDRVNQVGAGKVDNDDSSFARFGFTGETQVNSVLTGYATFVHNFTADGTDEDKTRLAFVGLNYDKMGSLDFGRNYGVVTTVRNFTDASDFDDLVGQGLTATSASDVGMLDRASSLATYTNKDAFGVVDGLDLYLQYQAKNTEENSKLSKKNGDGIGLTTTYEHDATGLGFGATYSKHNRVDAQKTDNTGDNAEIWAIASKYQKEIGDNSLYAAVSWAETNNLVAANNVYLDSNCATACLPINNVADKTKGFEAIVKYTIELGNQSSITPQVAYNQTRGYNLNVVESTNGVRHNAQTKADLTKFLVLGAGYQFNTHFDTSIGYRINLVDEKATYTQQAGVEIDDRLEMRVTYSF